MKSKTSFFNKYIVLEDLKRYWGVSLVYFLGLFLNGPLQISMLLSGANSDLHDRTMRVVENFLTIKYSEIQIIFSIGFSILLAMLILRYLHQNKSTTVMHSFPITRGQLFTSHSAAGALLLLIPVLLNSVILIMILGVHNDGSKLFQEVFTITGIFKWMGITTINNVIAYFISSLVAMISGISLGQGILSAIFIFFPAGFGFLMIINLDHLLYGFTINQNYIQSFFINIFPATSLLFNNKITSNLLLWYALLSILLYFGAYYLYKRRHLESATDPIAFDILKPIFKYGVTFCTMVLGGAYFYGMEKMENWLYIGYFLGGLFGYIIAEMIIRKSIWVFRNLKGLILYFVVILIVFAGIKIDIFGFERRVPDLEDIESAYYGNHLYRYWEDREKSLKGLENIESIRSLHQELIQNKNEFKHSGSGTYKGIGIVYELKNGGLLAREYIVPYEFVKNNMNLNKIYSSEEFKRSYYDIFNIGLTEINYIEISPVIHQANKDIQKIRDKNELAEMINAIKSDILDETYEEFVNYAEPWANIDIYYDNMKETTSRRNHYRLDLYWKKSYRHLSKWLKENGYYEKSRIIPKDVEYIVVEEISNELKKIDDYGMEDIEKQLNESGNVRRIEIRDKDKIEEVLVNYNIRRSRSKEYIIGIYFANTGNYLGMIEEKDLPKFLKDYFK